jgi:tol-pal system protein YbgF
VFNHQYRIPRNYFILNLGDIEDLLKGGVSDKRIVKLINKHGISFVATDENLEILRSAGANEAVIEAVRRTIAESKAVESAEVAKKIEDTPKLREEQESTTAKTTAPQEKSVNLYDSASKLYETAFSTFKDKKYKEAREKFETFIKEFPKNELADDAQFWIAETHYYEKDFESAILAYEVVLKKYPNSEKAPAALLKQGLSFIEMGDERTGKIILEKLGERYPTSKEAELARERIEGLLEKKTAIKVKQVTGEVKIIDIIDRTITIVKKIKGNIVEIVITVDDKTKITLAKEKRTLEDVKVGDKVTIKYTEDDGKNVAKSIIVKPISL